MIVASTLKLWGSIPPDACFVLGLLYINVSEIRDNYNGHIHAVFPLAQWYTVLDSLTRNEYKSCFTIN